ncbi:MAG: hypothetical protein ABIR18_01890 [Chitinophagaceae bacterium]
MWSEEMDRKIKEAAENDIHGYEDKSWKDMEVLLDKHLPQKKKRRGIIVFFLLAALGLSGYLLVSSISSSKKPVVQQNKTTLPASTPGDQQKTSPAKEITDNKNDTAVTEKTVTDNNKTKVADQITSIDQPGNNEVNTSATNNSIASATKNPDSKINGKNNTVNNSSLSSTTPVQSTNRSNTKQPGQLVKKNNTIVVEKKSPAKTIAEPIATTAANQDKEQKSTTATPESIVKGESIPAPSQPATTTTAQKKVDNDLPVAKAPNEPVKKEQKAKQNNSKFSFNFSFGPDLSSVGIKNPGQVKAQFGLGVGYAITDKISVRTGFFAGKKIYTADSNSYKVPNSTPYSPANSPFRIDADCFVYEIPVNVVYNFAQSKKHNWFVSAGLSSYLMKEEKYIYNYKTPGGQQVSYPKEFKNENQHIFSILGLSGGYQYHVSKRFSLLVEPYIKMPLSGVGHGNVKLNSTGVLFTATLKPFGKK